MSGVADRIYLDIEELTNNDFGLFYYSYTSPNRSGDKMKSQISLKFTQASGSSSKLFINEIDTSSFLNYLPGEGFELLDENEDQ